LNPRCVVLPSGQTPVLALPNVVVDLDELLTG
jgi:hypothetical protein